MDIAAQLLTAHSRGNANLVLNYVLADAARVPELMQAFLEGEYRVVQRAAMVVGDLGRVKPLWLEPWHGRMITAADHPEAHDAVRRNVMRYFSELSIEQIGPDDEGRLVDLAFRLLADQQAAVAIRVFAMQIIYNYVARYPVLADELAGIIELTLAEGTTPGFRSRGRKILGWLER